MSNYRAIANEYERDLRARLLSEDDNVAWNAYRESMEFFDGEREIEAAHKARFFAERAR